MLAAQATSCTHRRRSGSTAPSSQAQARPWRQRWPRQSPSSPPAGQGRGGKAAGWSGRVGAAAQHAHAHMHADMRAGSWACMAGRRQQRAAPAGCGEGGAAGCPPTFSMPLITEASTSPLSSSSFLQPGRQAGRQAITQAAGPERRRQQHTSSCAQRRPPINPHACMHASMHGPNSPSPTVPSPSPASRPPPNRPPAHPPDVLHGVALLAHAADLVAGAVGRPRVGHGVAVVAVRVHLQDDGA